MRFIYFQDASTDPSILAVRGAFNATYPLTKPVYTGHEVLFKIGIISDPDKASRSDDSVKSPHDTFLTGVLIVVQIVHEIWLPDNQPERK